MNERYGDIMYEILKRDGLTVETLRNLSYKSQLGISLKKNLHYFDEKTLFDELYAVNMWYDECSLLHDLALDYRIKSIQSARLKYNKYYPDHQTRKVFDDLLGFRSLCDNYQDVFRLKNCADIRLADMSDGKANDDGYRGVHAYYQLDNYSNDIGCILRKQYESGKIQTEAGFKEVLSDVLSNSERY